MIEKALRNYGDKDKFITFCSFVCAVMIIGLHSFNAGTLPLNSVTRFVEAIISHGLFVGAVPIFFFTSGYLFYRNTTCMKDCFVKQKKRVVSVVMPFFAWSTFYYLIFAIGNKVFGISMVNGVDTSILGIFKGIFFYEYCFPLWFLWQLMVYIFISQIVFLVLSKKKLSVAVYIILAVVGFLGIKLEANIFGSSRMLFCVNYFTYYFTGGLLAQNKNVFEKAKEYVLKLPLYLLSIIYLLFSILGGMVYEGYINTFNERCIVPFVAIALWALLYKINSVKKDIKVPEKVSTIIIYAIHPFIGMVTGRLIGLLSLPTIISYLAGFVICTIICCAISLIIRYIKPIYWVFSGNR